MKKYIYLFLFPLVAYISFSCSQTLDVEEIGSTAELRDFYALVPSSATRVCLEQDQSGLVIWEQEDYVSVFAGTTKLSKYKVKEGCSGKTETTLIPCDTYNIQSNNAGLESFYYASKSGDLSANVAFYPFGCASSCKQESGVYLIDVAIPTEQYDAISTFGKNLLPIVAVTENANDNKLFFKNIMGLLRLSISGDIDIDGINVYGNNHEKLSGQACVKASSLDSPSIEFKENAYENVNLSFAEKLHLKSDKPKEIFVVLPPQEYKKGITIEYIIGDATYKKVIDQSIVLHRAEIVQISQDITKAGIIKDIAVPAISWIDDDFTGVSPKGVISSAYQTIHDICLEKGFALDYAIQSRIEDTETNLPVKKIEIMKQWYSEGFRYVYHPTHNRGWYNYDVDHPHNASLIEDCILDTKRAFGWYGLEVPDILVWPGNAAELEDNHPIVKKYFDCAVMASYKGTNHLANNDRYMLRRLSFQSLGKYMTKTEFKEYIRTAIENNDWIIFASHVHSIDESTTPDENSYNIANVVEILEYANKLCQMKHTSDVWNNRKLLWVLEGK